MALPKKTYVFGVDDCKLFPISADTDTTFTCEDGIDVPGIKQISITPNVELKSLTGDEMTVATKVKQPDVACTIEFAELSQEILAAITGGTVVEGSGNSTFRVEEGNDPPYFQLQAKINGVDYAGDMHIIIYTLTHQLTVLKAILQHSLSIVPELIQTANGKTKRADCGKSWKMKLKKN